MSSNKLDTLSDKSVLHVFTNGVLLQSVRPAPVMDIDIIPHDPLVVRRRDVLKDSCLGRHHPYVAIYSVAEDRRLVRVYTVIPFDVCLL